MADALAPALQRAQTLLATDPAAARREAQALAARAPNDPRVRLILASALRRTGDAEGALKLLVPLAKAFPQAANTQYELGLARLARGESAPARAALERATALAPQHPDAWIALGEALFAAGDLAGADAAFRRQQRVNLKDPALVAPFEALMAGQADAAEAQLTALARARPSDLPTLKLLGEARLALGDFAGAEAILAQALALAPDDAGALFNLASAQFNQQKAAEASAAAQRLLARDPASPAYRNLAAACASLRGDFDRAIALNEALVAQFPANPNIQLNHGHALRTVGRTAEAVAAYRRAIALAPQLGESWWALANLKMVRFDEADVTAMRTQLARLEAAPTPSAANDRLHLHYALGKALEDRRQSHDAFAAYAAGAALRKALVPYDGAVETGVMDRSAALLDAGFFAARGSGGSPAADPIFVVGLPRSGSTLIEQILASHSQVEGVMELPDIGILAQGLIARHGGGDLLAYPALLSRLSADERIELGEAYLARTRIHRRTDRPFFIDKMPPNFRHLGLIRLILPHAKIVDARRHPMAVGFSAFKQHFNQGQNFSYDLADIGAYYGAYVRLMRALDAALPGWIHRVIYEDMVEQTEPQIRALLAFCGLPFEAACLRYWETERAVKTVSSEQVRRPIFREGLHQWRAFEPWLGPLKTALGPALERWRD